MHAVIKSDKCWCILRSKGFIWPDTNYTCSAAKFMWRACLQTSVFCIHTDVCFSACTMLEKKCMCNTHMLSLESLSFWWLLANVPLFISNEVSFWCFFLCFSSCWQIFSLLLRSSCLVFAFSLPSVLWGNHDWAGCFTTLGSSLQGQLSPGGAIKLCGGVWQGSVCHAGPFAGEGPGGTILCTPEEPACSAGHLHLCAPTTGALPCQAERFKYYCS